MSKLFSFVFVSFLMLNGVIAQDTLKMLNGNIWIVKIERVNDNEISFFTLDKKKNALVVRETRNIFSMIREGQEEKIFYKYNPDIGNFYQLDEMRAYMVGERDAEKYYKSPVPSIISFGGGVVAGYLVSEGTSFAAVTPFVISTIMMIPGSKVKRNEKNAQNLKNNSYRAGYKRVANGKKFLSSLKYGAIGMLGSFITFRIAD